MLQMLKSTRMYFKNWGYCAYEVNWSAVVLQLNDLKLSRDAVWRYVTLCDVVWRCVTLCDVVWRYVLRWNKRKGDELSWRDKVALKDICSAKVDVDISWEQKKFEKSFLARYFFCFEELLKIWLQFWLETTILAVWSWMLWRWRTTIGFVVLHCFKVIEQC